MIILFKIIVVTSICLFVFGLPLAYSIWRGYFWRTVFFTWFIWIAYACPVLPLLTKLTYMVTGEPGDVDGLAFSFGVTFGWFPGIVCAMIGKSGRRKFFKNNESHATTDKEDSSQSSE